MISFNSIPIDIRTPYHAIEFDNSRALQGLAVQSNKILVIGQRRSTGSVAPNTPVQVLSAAQAEGFFGRGSMLHAMIAALKSANSINEVWAVALDDAGGGTSATSTITFAAGSASESGTLHLYVHGVYVPVAITSGDDQDAIATAAAAAINDAVYGLQVTAAAATNVVTLTARHAGESGNDIDVRLNYYATQKIPAGVTPTVVAMSGGATNPDISTAISAIGDEQYHTVICAFTDSANLTALETELSNRWGPMVQKEGHAFAAADGTHAALTTLGNGRNSQFLTLLGLQGSPTSPWEAAAIVGAVDAAEPDPARPRQTLHLPGLLAPAEIDRYTRAERDLHLHEGLSTFSVDQGARVVIERLITTYQTNGASVADTSYLDVTTMRTLAYLRFSMRARIALKYPRMKLADDTQPEVPGQAIVRPKDIRNELIALFSEWQDAGLVENLAQFKDDLVVERNGSDPNRIDALVPPDLINQFRVFAAQIQFLL